MIVSYAEKIAALPELNSFTFENNTIVDEDAVCALLANLKSFEKLENINIRGNRLTNRMVDALVEGFRNQKELRVSPS